MIALDYNTPRALADHLASAREASLPAGFEQVYRRLCASGASGAAADMLREVSRLRPVYTGPTPLRAVRLAAAPDDAVLICFPSVLPLSAPTEYARFAAALNGRHEVHAIPQPGFADDEPLPADLDALAQAHVAAVGALTAGRPYVLCGHSSGGWIAHLVAEQLTERPPMGVVLLDSFWPSSGFLRQDLPRLLEELHRRQDQVGITEVGMTRLTAMGGYLRLLDAWSPAVLTVPVLHVAAARDGAAWRLPHTAAQSPGDHFTMLDLAADTVGNWLQAIAGDS
jgi:cyclohexanecarboxylate-CoA ligase